MRWTRRNERGATLVEAAIITPLLFTLIFGVFEFSMYFKDKLSASNATRTGARIGSAQGQAALADYFILQQVEKSGSSWGRIEKVVVYKAANSRSSVPAACKTATVGVTGVCNVYNATDFAVDSATFTAVGYTKDDYWPASSRVTSLTAAGGPDFLGVWVTGPHDAVTNIGFGDKQLEDDAIMRLEPTA
jgi:TadE-like protein